MAPVPATVGRGRESPLGRRCLLPSPPRGGALTVDVWELEPAGNPGEHLDGRAYESEAGTDRVESALADAGVDYVTVELTEPFP